MTIKVENIWGLIGFNIGLIIMLLSIEPDNNQLSHGFMLEYWGWGYIWEIVNFWQIIVGLLICGLSFTLRTGEDKPGDTSK